MQKKIQYLEIAKHALLLTWNNKFLWVFGLLIFLGSLPSTINFNGGKSAGQSQFALSLGDMATKYPLLSIFGTLLIIAAVIIFIMLRILGAASVIKSANNIVVYRQSSVKAILLETKKYLKKLFLLEVIVVIAAAAIALVLFIPIAYLYAMNGKILAGAFFAIALVIIIPILVLAYYVRRYAYIYIVLGEMDIKTAIDSAYVLLEKNFKDSIVSGLVAIVLNILLWAAIFVIALILLIVMSPFALVSYLFFANTGLLVVSLLGGAFTIAILLTIFAWFEAFLQTFWVLFFQQLTLEKQEEKKILEKLEVDGQVPTPEPV